MLLLANVNAASAAITCGDESEHRSAPVGREDHSNHAPGGDQRPDAQVPQDDDSVPLCCEALASCSMSVDAAADCAEPVVRLRTALVVSPETDRPQSRLAAPEPPPPRARA